MKTANIDRERERERDNIEHPPNNEHPPLAVLVLSIG